MIDTPTITAAATGTAASAQSTPAPRKAPKSSAQLVQAQASDERVLTMDALVHEVDTPEVSLAELPERTSGEAVPTTATTADKVAVKQ